MQDANAVALGATDANAIPLGIPASSSETIAFTPAATFQGPRQGMVFKAGPNGVGYYADAGLQSSALQTPAVVASTGEQQLCPYFFFMSGCRILLFFLMSS